MKHIIIIVRRPWRNMSKSDLINEWTLNHTTPVFIFALNVNIFVHKNKHRLNMFYALRTVLFFGTLAYHHYVWFGFNKKTLQTFHVCHQFLMCFCQIFAVVSLIQSIYWTDRDSLMVFECFFSLLLSSFEKTNSLGEGKKMGFKVQ